MSDYQFNPSLEQWKAIPGFPGYEVSDHGRVVSWRNRWGTRNNFHIFRPHLNSKGYLYVALYKDGKRFNKGIHYLELLSFVGPCPPGMQACHNDGIRGNNYIINLRWDTPTNNQRDRLKHGTHLQGEKNPNAKLSDEQVRFIKQSRHNGFSLSYLANLFAVSETLISGIARSKAWKHIP